jgi:hypothetical protein
MTMTITRRELLAGVPAIVTGVARAGAVVGAAAGAVVIGKSGEVAPSAPVGPAPVPSADDLRQWEIRYKARYKAAHKARNRAIMDFATPEPDKVVPKRADLVLEDLEAEHEGAMSLVDESRAHDVAKSRGDGYGARQEGKPATENPHWGALARELNYGGTESHDLFMAWYAGWVQADPNPVMERPRGYIPPAQNLYTCPLCGVVEGSGRTHTGPDREQTARLWGRSTQWFAPWEACEDHLEVKRPLPVQRPGASFT